MSGAIDDNGVISRNVGKADDLTLKELWDVDETGQDHNGNHVFKQTSPTGFRAERNRV